LLTFFVSVSFVLLGAAFFAGADFSKGLEAALLVCTFFTVAFFSVASPADLARVADVLEADLDPAALVPRGASVFFALDGLELLERTILLISLVNLRIKRTKRPCRV
jgi:hypothetical protein